MKIFVTNDTCIRDLKVTHIETIENGFYNGVYMDFYKSNLPRVMGNYLSSEDDGVWYFWGKNGVWYFWNDGEALQRRKSGKKES